MLNVGMLHSEQILLEIDTLLPLNHSEPTLRAKVFFSYIRCDSFCYKMRFQVSGFKFQVSSFRFQVSSFPSYRSTFGLRSGFKLFPEHKLLDPDHQLPLDHSVPTLNAKVFFSYIRCDSFCYKMALEVQSRKPKVFPQTNNTRTKHLVPARPLRALPYGKGMLPIYK
ncbi:MAG: hypothetical protein CFE24_03390 [Flavobacterium sp. BFFFF2]|nr:MAG: hypothetical protein CFE24_03390 [Flavobacterium sp. BFFFF2]